MSNMNPNVNALGDADIDGVKYWVYAPGKNACMWEDFYSRGIMGIGWGKLGDLNAYADESELGEKVREIYNKGKNVKHALWQFAHDVKPGDVVFAKNGCYEIIGRGIVESDWELNNEAASDYDSYTRKVRWTHKGHWPVERMLSMKTLTDITIYTDTVNKISALFDDEYDEEDTPAPEYPPYSIQDFLSDVFISENAYNTLTGLLRRKKNLILQGAPGTGKTFLAKRLAYSMMGVRDSQRVMMIQFHQSYSYEDFIMGFRPSASGFELRPGVFYNFCQLAEDDPDNDYFFVIDEINRGNLSKIFGELFMLIENDKRGSRNKLQLLYSDELFSVPENLYIIGLMNTADRSLALVDYALRRRFAFFDLKPGFSSEGFRSYTAGLGSRNFEALIRCVESLNEHIAEDKSLGEGFCIGHSYFCNLTPENLDSTKLSRIVEYELIPLLKEYWFDEPQKVSEWSANLRAAIR